MNKKQDFSKGFVKNISEGFKQSLTPLNPLKVKDRESGIKTKTELLNQKTVKKKIQDLPKSDKESLETKFITKFMRRGKKEKAEITLFKALKKVEQELIKKEKGNLTDSSVSLTSPELGLNQKGSTKQGKVQASLDASSKGKGNSSFSSETKRQSKESVLLKNASSKGNVNDESQPKVELGKLLEKIIDNAKPLIRLKKIRIAGVTHQKPVALTRKQAETDAIKRIILNAKARSEKSATLKLAKEFEEIYLNLLSNKTLTEVRELHKLAESNKANITLK